MNKPDPIPARLAALKTTPTPDLKRQWRDLFDSEPPPFNRPYLESRLAYRIQELTYGGLKPETVKRLSVSAIARKLGMDRKTVRKHLEGGIASPAYSPREAQPRLIAPYEDYLRARITAWPDLSGKRLLRELKERGYAGCYSVVTDFLRDARPPRVQPFERRFETAAGKQAQVDFAQLSIGVQPGPPIGVEKGPPRRDGIH